MQYKFIAEFAVFWKKRFRRCPKNLTRCHFSDKKLAFLMLLCKNGVKARFFDVFFTTFSRLSMAYICKSGQNQRPFVIKDTPCYKNWKFE